MLRKEFVILPIDSLFNATIITVDIHVINLDYPEERHFCLTELSDGSKEKLNRILVGLNTTAVIPESDD